MRYILVNGKKSALIRVICGEENCWR